MDTDELALHLIERATRDEQVAHRVQPGDEIEAVRGAVRRLARE